MLDSQWRESLRWYKELFKSDAEQRLNIEERRNSVQSVIYFASPFVLMFIGINYAFDHIELASVELFAMAMLVLPAALLMKHDRFISTCENLLMMATVLIFAELLHDGAVMGSGMLWAPIMPFAAFYIMGMRRGWLWVLAFGLAIAIAIVLDFKGASLMAYSREQQLAFLPIFAFYALLAYASNSVRLQYQGRLETKVRERTARLEHIALHDTLTDLPNRTLLQNHLQHIISRNPVSAKSFAVLIMDLDRFQEINDILGHENGDLVLQEVAARLQSAAGEHNFVARLGADEFVVVLLDTTGSEQACKAAKSIQKQLEAPYVIEKTPIEVETSGGIALYPDHGREVPVLLQHADVALRMAKQEKHSIQVYDSNRNPYDLYRLKLFGQLRNAITGKQLCLYYQPKINLKTGKVAEVEALVRWNHPKDGMISPGEFIPLAEETGLINPLSLWVLDEAMRQSSIWRQAGMEIGIAVNLSVRNLTDPDLLKKIEAMLGTHGVSGQNITLEITESAVMKRPDITLKMLPQLRKMGFCLSLDDFGTGYSSLTYLKDLPVDELKIDQGFVMGMLESEGDSTIVQSTIALAHNFGLAVVAEGVESREILDALKAMGCDKAQGFYMSKPVAAEALVDWLSDSKWGPGKAANM